jgi:hypothetical protein
MTSNDNGNSFEAYDDEETETQTPSKKRKFEFDVKEEDDGINAPIFRVEDQGSKTTPIDLENDQ